MAAFNNYINLERILGKTASVYCPCRSKIMSFQKLSYQKLANFRSQTKLLWHHLTAKLCNLGWCSKTLHVDKDVSIHLRPFMNDLHEN